VREAHEQDLTAAMAVSPPAHHATKWNFFDIGALYFKRLHPAFLIIRPATPRQKDSYA
jgi:hypothetical protein